MTRVTSTSMNGRVMASLQASLSRLQETQAQVASGKRLTKPSDSPTDTGTAMKLRTDQQRTDQLGRAMDDSAAWLNTADQALTQTDTLLTRVRQLVLAGSNGTATASDRAAMATEVDHLRASIADVANTSYLGRPIFAGTQDTATAFDPTTGAYLGNTATVDRTIAVGGEKLAVGMPGSQAFTTLLADPAAPGGAGILARISDALRSGDTAGLQAGLTALDGGAEAVRTAQSVVGARTQRLENVRSLADIHATQVTTQLSSVEGIDLAKALTDLSVQQTAYQAALQATAKVIQPSLLDFLR